LKQIVSFHTYKSEYHVQIVRRFAITIGGNFCQICNGITVNFTILAATTSRRYAHRVMILMKISRADLAAVSSVVGAE